MRGCRRSTTGLVFLLVSSAMVSLAVGEEGMWLFTNPPEKALKERYGFTFPPGWLEHVQKSCVRVGRGGSGSLVSPHGLLMTNHHVGRGQLQKLSSADRNLLETGFYAASYEDELKCPDLEVRILWSIDDATDDVTAVVTEDMSPAEAEHARQRRIAEIVRDAERRTGLDCEMVTLYHGARFHLYCYRRYDDVRLVMAPESQIAAFGGDTDNFEYPRYCLDVTFFRIYENGRPLENEHYLKWNEAGASEGDLVFVTGHPARTRRLYTVDHLKYLRDVAYPRRLRSLWRSEVKLNTFSERSAEHARIARASLKGVENARKALTGYLNGLLDPAVMRAKQKAEQALRVFVQADPARRKRWGDAWDDISRAERTARELTDRYTALEQAAFAGGSRLFAIARHLVRLAAELPKRNGDRLREYRQSRLDSLYVRLYSPAPIYDALEIHRLTSGLTYMAELFGADDPMVTRLLAGKSPRQRAVELVRGTKLKNVLERKRLAKGGADALAASGDPMIRLAYEIDAEARAVRKRYEDEVESVEREAYARIAAARFARHGQAMYPDATGSLRITYGTIRGFEEDGRAVPAFTDFAGLFKRYAQRGGVAPFTLPKRWLTAKDRLDLSLPLNFISTTDVIGGNSGSPAIDRDAQVVGLVFDINLPALVWDVAYTDHRARTVNVDARAILEGLRKVYHADRLVKEILGR
ncbi:MAG: S46 family peptidase [Planctomycetota bacterium]|nr:MAG: S46 family peptidase [Planctomycetota bacterium]